MSGFDFYLENIGCNDETGSFQNSWLDQQKSINILPSAAGDNNAWTRQGTDSGANWSQVDEVTPNDITDYVQSNTLNQIDDYNCAASGLTDEVIDMLAVGVRKARLTGLNPASFVLRSKAASGGTVEESSAITTTFTAWHHNVSGATPVARLFQLILYDLPGASTTAWTPTDLDAMQIGYRLSATSLIEVWISTAWACVSYHAAATADQRRRLLAQVV